MKVRVKVGGAVRAMVVDIRNNSRELPNGWLYSLSIGDWRAADGTSYEGRGLPPDIMVHNELQALQNGVDQVLDTAIDLLR